MISAAEPQTSLGGSLPLALSVFKEPTSKGKEVKRQGRERVGRRREGNCGDGGEGKGENGREQ